MAASKLTYGQARLFQETDVFVMKTLRPIRKGEEILNDYGPLPRSDLLRRYGYITPKYAKYDVVELPRDLIIRCTEHHHDLEPTDMAERVSRVSVNAAKCRELTLPRWPFSETMTS